MVIKSGASFEYESTRGQVYKQNDGKSLMFTFLFYFHGRTVHSTPLNKYFGEPVAMGKMSQLDREL